MVAQRQQGRLLHLLGARLAEIRRARKFTQERLAEAADVDPQTIQRAETGKVSLSLSRLQLIATALGIPMTELFAGIGTPIPEPPWSPEEALVVREWRAIPEDRRQLALRVLAAFKSG